MSNVLPQLRIWALVLLCSLIVIIGLSLKDSPPVKPGAFPRSTERPAIRELPPEMLELFLLEHRAKREMVCYQRPS